MIRQVKLDFYHWVYISFCAASATLSWSDNAFACACVRKEVLQLQLEVRVVWHTGRQTEACAVPFFEGLVALDTSVVTTATLRPVETLVTTTGATVVAVLLPSPSCVPSALVCERHQMARCYSLELCHGWHFRCPHIAKHVHLNTMAYSE